MALRSAVKNTRLRDEKGRFMSITAATTSTQKPAKSAFLELPGELRNLIYDFLGSTVDKTEAFAPAIKVDRKQDDRLTPRFPVILHLCKQLRQEYLMSHQNKHRLACHDYAAFIDWSKGFGAELVQNIVELHLTVPITKSQYKLRVRYEILHAGPYLRFWFDIGPGKSLSQNMINELSSGFAHRFPADHTITILEFLDVVNWLHTRGPIEITHGLFSVRNAFNFMQYRLAGDKAKKLSRAELSIHEYTTQRGRGERLWDMTIMHK